MIIGQESHAGIEPLGKLKGFERYSSVVSAIFAGKRLVQPLLKRPEARQGLGGETLALPGPLFQGKYRLLAEAG
jgi:hypothetical protein